MKKLMIAAAGAGKTTFLVQEALKEKEKKVLITTFTDENVREIRKKIVAVNGFLPKNIEVKGWFSFLLQDCLRPFQCVLNDQLFSKSIGFNYWTEGRSGFKYMFKGHPIYWGENDFFKYYFDSNLAIYSDKLSKFVVKIYEKDNDLIFKRLSKIYGYIFIDEIQDLAGYDLDIIKNIFLNIQSVIAVGDPRQTTYSTHHSQKYEKYSKGKIKDFFSENLNGICEIDEFTLCRSHRNEQIICRVSSQLFPEFTPSESCECCNDSNKEHLGIFYVPESRKLKYLQQYKPTQLRWDSRNKKVNYEYPVMNIGSSKGLTLDRVMLYPTSQMIEWFKDQTKTFEQQTQAKFYVGLTRAKYSLGILVADKELSKLRKEIPIYE
ncbi:UvrD-helicase domain-containing protein [Acinetobacter ursingii]|uniref:UvrD-helicase domain-containing protein n=1 Tax=Acinetobacter ursingii TaxID=108980 RepID=UPI00195EE283|nr:UvrD-helicase domain-containing protein [Acinetobacter ursingii]VTX92613.1 RecBCD enzyme subunit RecB [Acinetobacter ursingii]